VRDPKCEVVDGRRRWNAEDKSMMRWTIYNQLHTALQHGHDALVLGSFGCGGFNNPPEEVADLYDEVIRTYFPSSFARIVFAIVSSFSGGVDRNFEVFDNKFKKSE
jgi:uncharacterized protein (TIGR02452 family)